MFYVVFYTENGKDKPFPFSSVRFEPAQEYAKKKELEGFHVWTKGFETACEAKAFLHKLKQ